MRLVLIIFIGLLGLISVNAEVLYLNTEEYTSIHSINYPNNYVPNWSESWTIAPGGGSGVEFIIRDLDISSDNNDYLLIGPGKKLSSDELPLMFTYYLKNERKYRILYQDDIYIEFKSNSGSTPRKGFFMDLKRIMETPTTTDVPTTEEIPNTINPYENYTIYLQGKDHRDFWANDSEIFRFNLAQNAEKYCFKNNISIDENITVYENVNYHHIGQCNIEWPNNDKCIEIIYSIGVSYDNETDTYQLNRTNLQRMWDENKNNMNLTDMNLIIRDVPNEEIYLTWLYILLGILIVFMIMLYCIWRNNWFGDLVVSPLRQDDEDEIKKDEEFFPIPHQSVPPLYGSEYYANEELNTNMHDLNENISNQYTRDNFAFDNDENLDMFTHPDLNGNAVFMSLPNYSRESHPAQMRNSIDTLDESTF